jgi:hypothetical protein
MSVYFQVRRHMRPEFDVSALDEALVEEDVAFVVEDESPPTVPRLEVAEALAQVMCSLGGG